MINFLLKVSRSIICSVFIWDKVSKDHIINWSIVSTIVLVYIEIYFTRFDFVLGKVNSSDLVLWQSYDILDISNLYIDEIYRLHYIIMSIILYVMYLI